jgi:hypothetical protein
MAFKKICGQHENSKEIYTSWDNRAIGCGKVIRSWWPGRDRGWEWKPFKFERDIIARGMTNQPTYTVTFLLCPNCLERALEDDRLIEKKEEEDLSNPEKVKRLLNAPGDVSEYEIKKGIKGVEKNPSLLKDKDILKLFIDIHSSVGSSSKYEIEYILKENIEYLDPKELKENRGLILSKLVDDTELSLSDSAYNDAILKTSELVLFLINKITSR